MTMAAFKLALLILFAHFPMSALAKETCVTDSAGIVQVFDKGIALNEKFKRSVAENDSKSYEVLRAQTEKLSERVVIPCVVRARAMLSDHDDPVLANRLLKLVVSYENVADETVSYALGQIFGENPKVLESAIRKFSHSEQKLILAQLQSGWINVRSKYSAAVKDREIRLRRLRDAIAALG
jgi:hypothetical protein